MSEEARAQEVQGKQNQIQKIKQNPQAPATVAQDPNAMEQEDIDQVTQLTGQVTGAMLQELANRILALKPPQAIINKVTELLAQAGIS